MRLATLLTIFALFGMISGLPIPKANKSTGAGLDISSNISLPLNISTAGIVDDDFFILPATTSEAKSYVKTGSHLVARGKPWPPRDRKVAEEMKNGLLECYQTCFKSENGKSGVDIYEW